MTERTTINSIMLKPDFDLDRETPQCRLRTHRSEGLRFVSRWRSVKATSKFDLQNPDGAAVLIYVKTTLSRKIVKPMANPTFHRNLEASRYGKNRF